MDILRLILIGVGVVLILAIYFWGQMGQRKARQASMRPVEEMAGKNEMADPSEQPPSAPKDDAPTILALHLIAAEKPIDGQALFQAAAEAGLEFGDMDIFHCTVAHEEQPIFSMANMVKPGTFDLSQLEYFTTPGVVMFLQLPGPDVPMAAFDTFLAVGQHMSERLGVTLCDGRRRPLNEDEISAMRAQVTAYC